MVSIAKDDKVTGKLTAANKGNKHDNPNLNCLSGAIFSGGASEVPYCTRLPYRPTDFRLCFSLVRRDVSDTGIETNWHTYAKVADLSVRNRSQTISFHLHSRRNQTLPYAVQHIRSHFVEGAVRLYCQYACLYARCRCDNLYSAMHSLNQASPLRLQLLYFRIYTCVFTYNNIADEIGWYDF